ncbi:MAG: dTMP kinase [Candidatus Parvarchaeota archaeon]|nr:dTMP kinase [Candidatus Parvarchaeota archaeon]
MKRIEQRKKGLFIVIEGLDGSGKDTQLEMLRDYLSRLGYTVKATNEPTSGKLGRRIRENGLSGKKKFTNLEMQLLFSLDRGEHLKNEIEPALAKGEIVLSGRYSPSTLAYGFAGGSDTDILEEANEGYRKPDVLIYIDVSYRTAIERLAKRRGVTEIYENSEFLKKTEEGYKRILGSFNSVVIDGTPSLEEVHKKVIAAVSRYI